MEKKHAIRRKILLKNKRFLNGLFTGSKSENLARLTVATKFQLRNLMFVIHYICNGEITFLVEHQAILRKARRIPALFKLQEKSEVLKLLKEPLDKQRAYLKTFSSLYSSILHPLFNHYQNVPASGSD